VGLQRTLPIRALKLDPGTIGRRIRERRLARNETQEAVGKACGLSQNSVMKIERGQTENSRHLTQIWAYLGLDLAELSDVYRSVDRQLAVNDQIEVSVRRKAHLIAAIRYEVVRLPEAGSGLGILITWTARNGATIAGVLDRAMIAEVAPEFLRCARELGIDPTKGEV
jgi:transcriptional regulator with XRE-family HTH domain